MYVAQVGKGRVGRLEGIKDRKNTRNEANGQNRGERERKCNTSAGQSESKTSARAISQGCSYLAVSNPQFPLGNVLALQLCKGSQWTLQVGVSNRLSFGQWVNSVESTLRKSSHLVCPKSPLSQMYILSASPDKATN